MIVYEKGDLLTSDCEYICHQVNCQGKMGSGIARAVREKWPHAYTHYHEWYTTCYNTGVQNGANLDPASFMLGKILIHDLEPGKKIIHMAGQKFCGYDGQRYTSYDAFWECLFEIQERVPKGSKIGFPCYIGCGLGGGSWDVIESMIRIALKDYDVHIYKLEE